MLHCLTHAGRAPLLQQAGSRPGGAGMAPAGLRVIMTQTALLLQYCAGHRAARSWPRMLPSNQPQAAMPWPKQSARRRAAAAPPPPPCCSGQGWRLPHSVPARSSTARHGSDLQVDSWNAMHIRKHTAAAGPRGDAASIQPGRALKSRATCAVGQESQPVSCPGLT